MRQNLFQDQENAISLTVSQITMILVNLPQRLYMHDTTLIYRGAFCDLPIIYILLMTLSSIPVYTPVYNVAIVLGLIEY